MNDFLGHFVLLMSDGLDTLRVPALPRIARIHQRDRFLQWSILTMPLGVQIKPCSNANALAAVREVTPNLLKILLICLATVCSLMARSPAISRFVFPRATSTKTSCSRWESNACARLEPSVDGSRAAASGVAPSRSNTARAASK